jgi:hypothetical protein
MAKVTIFVENQEDKDFIAFLLKSRYGLELPVGDTGGFILMSGSGNEQSKFKDEFLKSKDLGYTNIVIEDADYKENSSYGFDKQVERLEQLKPILGFEYFLFPDHENDGNLQVLFENCLQENKKQVIDCVNIYHRCLIDKGFEHKTPKTYHSRWNMIESGLLDMKNKRDFSDTTIWYIHGNPYLKRLTDFLDSFFT